MKKKIFAIAVCAALMLTTACSNANTSSDQSSSKTSTSSSGSSSSDNSSSTPSTENSSSNTSEESSASSTLEESKPESSVQEPSVDATNGKFVHGAVSGTTYTSSFLGLEAAFGDGWTILTDEELAGTNNIGDMSDENANKALDTNAVLYEMMAAKNESTSVNIVIENLNLTNNGKALSEEEYADLSAKNLKAQFEAVGFTDVELDKAAVGFMGKEMTCLNVKLTNEGKDIYEKLFPVSNGAYMGIITFAAADENELTEMMSLFKGV